jgi:N-methylhydantoinase A
MLNYKLTAVGKIDKLDLQPLAANGSDPAGAIRASRPVFFAETKEFVESAIYDGSRLGPGNRIEGPAVIEEALTTVALPPGSQCEVDTFGNYLIRVSP